MKKRIIALFLIISMLIGECLPVYANDSSEQEQDSNISVTSSGEIIDSGTVGIDGIVWELDSDYTITFSGSGRIPMNQATSSYHKYADVIKKVIIESEITEIGNSAFRAYDAIEEVEIRPSVECTISDSAFARCSALEIVTISDKVTSIGETVFHECKNLWYIELPESITEIGRSTFYSCENLKSVYVPSGEIGNTVFNNCIGLTNIILGKDVTGIGEDSFYNCKSLEEIEVESGNTMFVAENGVLFDANKEKLIKFPAKKQIENYVIPDSVKTIDRFAFQSCEFLEKVEMSDKVNLIDRGAFSECTNLKSVVLSDTLESIPSYFAKNCTALTTIEIPRSINEIGDNAFIGCPLETISIPAYVTTIKSNAFDCNEVDTIYFAGNAPSMSGAFINVPEEGIGQIYYPKDNETWTDNVKQELKGNWVLYEPDLMPVESWSIELSDDIFVYNGKEHKPEIIVKDGSSLMQEGIHYTVEYNNNMYPGVASIIIAGCGDYEGVITKTFTIEKGVLKATVRTYSGTYDGEVHSFGNPIVSSNVATEFEIYYSTSEELTDSNYKTAGLTTKPERVLTGTTQVYYYIVDVEQNCKALSGSTFIAIKPNCVTSSYSGKVDGMSHTPVIECDEGSTLYFSTSQELNYNNYAALGTKQLPERTTAGTTTVYYIAVPNANPAENSVITGSVLITLEEENQVQKTDIGECSVQNISNLIYNGKNQIPNIVVKHGTSVLEQDKDYFISNSVSVNAGNYSLTLNGMGEYSGSKTISFTISKASPVLNFNETEVTVTEGDDAFTNNLQIITDGNVTYSSDNTSVATVNSQTGLVEIVGAGSTYIRAKASAGTNYYAGEAEYSLTVNKKEVVEVEEDLELEDLSYSFGNVASSFNYPDKYNYSLRIYEMIFGKTTKAAFWYDRDLDITGGVWRGNCAGFSGTSALLADPTSEISIKDFNASAKTIGQLSAKSNSESHGINITEFIETMQIAQHTQLFTNEITKNRIYTSKHLNKNLKNLNGFYESVCEETENGRPVIVGLYQSGAHAVLAYDVKDVSDTESQIFLYDSNWPGEERILTLRKNSEGNFMEWSYEIGGSYGVWGTDAKSSSISYVPYAIIKEIWQTRGNLEENANVLSINSGSLAIYTSGDKPVATVTQGELSTTTDDIQVLDYFALERAETDTLLLSVPVDVYTFQNLDKSVEEFEVAMTNTNLGAKATTTADSITMAVDDSCNLNAVYIDAGEDDTYSITLNSTFSYDEDDVVVTGKGNGETMEVSQMKGSININNCQITSIKIDGKEINNYQITAMAGEGGTISPSGSTVVTSGESVLYTISPLEGYKISNVYVDGVSVGAVASYEFENIDDNHEIMAVFAKKEHSYDSGVVTKNATCTTSGTKTYTCTECGETKTESINALGHSYSSSYTTDKKATCTETGSKSKHCTRTGCTAKTSVTAITKLSHSYTNSCDKSCNRCSATRTISHTYATYLKKATLTANGQNGKKCSVCGYITSTTKTVYYPKTFKLSTSAYTYNGEVRKPSVTVKDSKGNTLVKDTDYTVSYESGRKAPGTYTVKITFKGKYEGTKRLYFTIAPKKVSGVSASQTTTTITLKWKKQTGADGYRVYKYDSSSKKYVKVKDVTGTSLKISSLKAGTAYKYKVRAYTKDDGTIWGSYSDVFATATKCKTPSITKISSTTKGKASLTWSNVSGESGYQVYYSSKKDSGYKKVASYKVNVVKGSKSKLTSGKTYYFKVRAYKKTDSGTVYSSWSTVKSVKAK